MGDQVATRGDRPVSRAPISVMTTAAAIISAAVIAGGIVRLAPMAPRRAPNAAYPAIRPPMNTSAGRICAARPCSGSPARVRRAW